MADSISAGCIDTLRAAAIAEKWPTPDGYGKLAPDVDIHLDEIAAERYVEWAIGFVHRRDGLHEGRGPRSAGG